MEKMHKYVIASTSYLVDETYIFPSSEEGIIENWGELGGLAQRHGDKDWENHEATIINTFGENVYEFDRDIDGYNGPRSLWKLIENIQE